MSFVSEIDDYVEKTVKRQLIQFIQHWQDNNQKRYLNAAKDAICNGKHYIIINAKDVYQYKSQFADIIFQQFYKYEHILNQAFTEFMIELQKHQFHEYSKREDEHRESYQVSFNLSKSKDSVRDLRCGQIGRLISFRGTVTRTSQVRPELKVGVFKCHACGKLSKPIIQQFKYTTPKHCSQNCNGTWEIEKYKSQFADFQKIRVQEDPTKIPSGSMPRSIDVTLRNEFTEKGQAGDICEIIGYLCVQPEIASMLKPGESTQLSSKSIRTRGMNQEEGISGIRGMRQLTYKLFFHAINIKIENNQFNEINHESDDEEQQIGAGLQKQPFSQSLIFDKIYDRLSSDQEKQINILKRNTKLYDDMAEALFPTIYGHIEIKKAILLQLIGGIHKQTKSKINIRGDINILIVGDPSSAKSQFLKCVNRFVPRSIYTNGKTTSAAGLTASVIRDENGNVGIEAGALLLADNGICCIDEFDKMQLKDQVAIHQAMEQQTISIAKAGVFATLNARTSILAAANPMFGRYDKSKSLKNNINLSAPIMSRFDLFFIVCDEANEENDKNLSDFIVHLHQNKDTTKAPRYSHTELKNFIAVARKIKPQITIQSAELLQKYYVEIRSEDKGKNGGSYKVTVRQLESMIRLSEAYARLDLSLKVQLKHVKQAYRLLKCSIIKLQKPSMNLNDDQEDVNQKMNNLSLHEKNYENKKRKQEENRKVISITFELYQQFWRNVIKIFKEKEKLHRGGEIDDEHQISQEDLCNYLLLEQYDNQMNDNMNETESRKKIINAMIKKLIKQERVLMIVEDSALPSHRILQIHPNYVQQ